MFKKKKSDIEILLENLKGSKDRKIIIVCQEEIRENLERALIIKYGKDKVVFLDGYTDEYMFKFMNARNGHEFYNIQNEDERHNDKPKNRLPMLATDNIYSKDIKKIINQIDKNHEELKEQYEL